MERPGEKLKRVRERLKLTYRDVEKASQQLAQRRASDEFAIALSRLADIENKGTVPTIFRLYSLCAIYRLNWEEVLGWYGVPLELLPAESLLTPLNETHAVEFPPAARFTVPQPADSEIDLNSTTFLSHVIRRWGKTGLSFSQRLGSGATSLRLYRPGGLVDVPGATSRFAGVDRRRQAANCHRWLDERDGPSDLFPGTPGRLPVRLVHAVRRPDPGAAASVIAAEAGLVCCRGD